MGKLQRMSAMRIVSLSEVAQHGPESELPWVVVDGEVFDVSRFAEHHPGGKQILLSATGKDASDAFNLYHHSGVLLKYREKLKIGELVQGRKHQLPVPFAQPLHFGAQYNSPYYKETHYKFAARVQRFVQEEVLSTLDQWCEQGSPPKELYLKMGREGFLACLTGASEFPREFVDAGTPEPED